MNTQQHSNENFREFIDRLSREKELTDIRQPVDIRHIAGLDGIQRTNGTLSIGPLATHRMLSTSDLVRQVAPLLGEAASHIGDVQVRNKGTIGGSVAHSDPAGDWPAAVIALNAELVVASKDGERTIGADNFFVDLMTTALGPGEILREIRVNKPSGRFGQAYVKMHHPASGFAVVGVAANLALDDHGACRKASIGITGVSSKAYRATAVESALNGNALDDEATANAAGHATDGVDVNGDLFASEDYRRHLAQVYTRRAIASASERAR